MEDINLKPKLRFSEFKNNWVKSKLGDNSTFSKGKGISKSDIVEDGALECIRYGELYTYYGETIQDIKSKTNLESNSLVFSEMNDVIIPASGETSLDIATASCVLKSGVALGGDLNIIKSNLNGVFLSYYLNYKKKFKIASLSQGVSVVHLYSTQLKTLDLCIPKQEEQSKIAEFLNEVDKKIELLSKKKKGLKNYKKGIIQKIFNQEIRFKDDNGNAYPDWETKKLDNYLVEYKDKSKLNNEYAVLTSSNKGLMLQSDYYGENRITDRDNKGFNIIPPNHITYRSRSDNRTFTFNINHFEFNGVISTYYPVFKIENGCNSFLVDYLNFNKNHIGKYSVGTSQTVLSFNALKSIKLKMPCKNEQLIIGHYLKELDIKLGQLSVNLRNLKEFKKGLLQQMFV